MAQQTRLEQQLKWIKVLKEQLNQTIADLYEQYRNEIESVEDTMWEHAVCGAIIDVGAEAENDLNECVEMLKKGKVQDG